MTTRIRHGLTTRTYEHRMHVGFALPGPKGCVETCRPPAQAGPNRASRKLLHLVSIQPSTEKMQSLTQTTRTMSFSCKHPVI